MDSAVTALAACPDYETENVRQAVRRAVEDAGLPELRNRTVLVKPNVLFPTGPEKAITTHPAVLEALLEVLHEQGARRVRVGDSPGAGMPDLAGRRSGLKAAAERAGGEWVNFREGRRIEVSDALIHRQFYPVRELADTDVLISLPKMKTHEMMYFTGAMKNLFGLIPGFEKSRFHFRYQEKDRFARMIVDLNRAVRPSFALMDAVVAMEGPGPGAGTPRPMGLIIASRDILALDWTAASLMGYEPRDIPILRHAADSGWWCRPQDIRVVGEDPSAFTADNYKRVKILKSTAMLNRFLPGPLYDWFERWWVPRPFFNHRTCIRCGACLKICPPEALSWKGSGSRRKVDIDYGICIRCYCCHEICPVKAIRVARW